MHRAASVSPRRIASTPSWIAVAPDEQAVDSEIGEPLVPNRSAIRSATVPKMNRSCQSLKRPGRGRVQKVGVGDAVVLAGGLGQRLPLRPFEFDRRHRDEQRAREVALFGRCRLGRPPPRPPSIARRSESMRRAEGLDRDEVDGAADRGAQSLGREAGDARECPSGRPSAPPSCPPAPAPSEVTTPMPVTATSGRPCASRVACAMLTSLTAASRGAPRLRRANARRRSTTASRAWPRGDQRRGQRHAGRRLSFHRMADQVAGRVDRAPGARSGRAEPLLVA